MLIEVLIDIAKKSFSFPAPFGSHLCINFDSVLLEQLAHFVTVVTPIHHHMVFSLW